MRNSVIKLSAVAVLIATAATGFGDVSRFGARSTAPIDAEVRDTLFQRVTNILVPVIDRFVPEITVPKVDIDGISITKAFKLREFHVGSIDVAFAAPSTAYMKLGGVTIHADDVQMHIKKWLGRIHMNCAASASVDLTDFTMEIAMDLRRNAATGALEVASAKGTSRFPKDIGVSIEFWGDFLCVVGSPLMSAIVRDALRGFLRDHMASTIAGVAKDLSDKVMGLIDVPLVASPVATATSLQMQVDLLAAVDRVKALPAPAVPRAALQPRGGLRGLAERDAAAWIKDSSVNTVMAALAAKGRFDHTFHLNATTAVLRPVIPEAWRACPGCELTLATRMTKMSAPAFTFDGQAITARLPDFSLVLGAVRNGSTVIAPLWTVGVNATVALRNISVGGPHRSAVHLQLAVPVLSEKTAASHIGPVNDKLISGLIRGLVQDLAVPLVNKVLAKGVALSYAGIGLVNLVLGDRADTSVLEFDVSLIPS